MKKSVIGLALVALFAMSIYGVSAEGEVISQWASDAVAEGAYAGYEAAKATGEPNDETWCPPDGVEWVSIELYFAKAVNAQELCIVFLFWDGWNVSMIELRDTDGDYHSIWTNEELTWEDDKPVSGDGWTFDQWGEVEAEGALKVWFTLALDEPTTFLTKTARLTCAGPEHNGYYTGVDAAQLSGTEPAGATTVTETRTVTETETETVQVIERTSVSGAAIIALVIGLVFGWVFGSRKT